MTEKTLPTLSALRELLLSDAPKLAPGDGATAPFDPDSPMALFFFARQRVKLVLAFALAQADPAQAPALKARDFARRVGIQRGLLLAPGDTQAWIDPFALDSFALAPGDPWQDGAFFSWGLSPGLLSLLPARQDPDADAGQLLAGLAALGDLGWSATLLGRIHCASPQDDARQALALREAFELERSSEHAMPPAKGPRL